MIDRQLYVEGDHVDPELIPSYGGHVAGPIWLGQASRVDAKELVGCWSLLEAWIYLYFLMFAPPVRLGYKNENKLLDIRLRLDMMTADEVRWIPYRTQGIWACWVSTWHGFIAYFDCVEPYMPDRVLR
ncbi:hypothetical protein M9H77_09239 [Catharanthus roseus]|uniref:Uncharacterized protein n=1 Tax=Catharanthus roseus TaxID=4058 RepID=A0ACC0C013_CATRO|nr:hypothetical protein M9H77_09239 [Catharanthus roseus]